ncbi:unnamed protein product [Mortierella alpina]
MLVSTSKDSVQDASSSENTRRPPLLQESHPYSQAIELEPSMAELVKPLDIFKIITVYQPQAGAVPDKPTFYATIPGPSPLFVDEKLGVLDLMRKTDRSIFYSGTDGENGLHASHVVESQLQNGKKLDNITVYQHLPSETLVDSDGEHEAFVLFPSYIEADGVTPHAGFSIQLNNSRNRYHLQREKTTVLMPEEAQNSAAFYRKRVKQPCEAVSSIFENYYDCYFKDRLHSIKRVPKPKPQSYAEDRARVKRLPGIKVFPSRVYPLTSFNTGMDAEELETFRPFNNIKIKTLQRAFFDPECEDVTRSLKLFLPDLPWVFIEGISGDFSQIRHYLIKRLKGDRAQRRLQTRRYLVHFNQREVDMVFMFIEADFQRGKAQARFTVHHVKFVILDDRETVRFIGPLPAPRGYARFPIEPTYRIEMVDGLDLDKRKSAGILGITRAVFFKPTTKGKPTPLSLCVINRSKTKFHLGHGSVWCRGIKIDLILNNDKRVDLKFSAMDVATFTEKIFLKQEYNAAVLTEVRIELDRLVEIAVGVFEESFFNYSKLDKNCLSYMYTLAMRLSHYRYDRAPRMDFPQQSVYSGRYTVFQRDEYQASVNHFVHVRMRMKVFQSKSKKEKIVHWVSRRGLDGDMVYLNPQ